MFATLALVDKASPKGDAWQVELATNNVPEKTGPDLVELQSVLSRLSSGSDLVILTEIIDDHPGRDLLEVEIVNNELVLRGSNPVAIVSAFNVYLRTSGQGHLSWGGNRLGLSSLPAQLKKIQRVSSADIFYNFNFTAHGYTTPFWSWPDWEREIDLMAFNGITHPLVITGIEEVYVQTFAQFGYTREEVRDWLVLPTHLPWQLMGNLHSDGPILSEALVAERAALGRRIIKRMKALGMQPVLPGYYGLIPDDFAARQESIGEKSPQVIEQGEWVGGYQRPPILDPNEQVFARVAAAYYEATNRVLGKVNYFAADPFHEGGKTAGIAIPAAARAIQQAMLSYNENAVWVLQAWHKNPRKDLLNAIDKSHSLVVNLWGDEAPAWNRNGADTAAFEGAPWVWSIIQNFGGNTGLSGNLDVIAAQHGVDGVFNNPAQSNLVGLGMAMEGVHQNPVVQDFMFDMRWRDPAAGPIDVENWLRNYADRRYGQVNENARYAWTLLGETVYHSGPENRQGTVESVFASRPSLSANRASTWGPDYGPYYDETKLEKAFRALLDAGRALSGVPAYHYDLIDTGRQVLANRGRKTLVALKMAFENGDVDAFEREKELFLAMILEQDNLLSLIPDFRLDTWLTRARNFGHTPVEKINLENSALRILTSWSAWDSDLRDYAHREWSGLLSGYYYPRWKLYLDQLSKVLEGSTETAPDLWPFEEAWRSNLIKSEWKKENVSHSVLDLAHGICRKYCTRTIKDRGR